MVNYDNFERLPLRHELEAKRLQATPGGVGPVARLLAMKVAGCDQHGEFKISGQAGLIDDLTIRDVSHESVGKLGHGHADAMIFRLAVG